jgi:uncharacterized protein
MQIERLSFAIVAAFVSGHSALAGAVDDGAAAYERGEYATAFQLWRPLAEQGDTDAKYDIGILYVEGHGVPQDYSEAVKWFRKAA